jgi:hypothetical protein
MDARLDRFATPAMLVALAAGLVWWSWGTWPDVLVDAGREAYVPWQLAAGRRLYADVAYLNGPLSPYWNALWLRIGGVGLRTLFLVNLATLGAIVVVLHRLVARAGGRYAAAAASAFFLAVFAFGQKVCVANYNYVFPYSHEMTHGLLLALVAVLAGSEWARHARPVALGVAGLALGFAFLTKPELFLAGAAATVTLVATVRRSGDRLRPGLTLGAVGLFAPWLVAWALLAHVMPAGDALQGTLGAWPWVLRGGVAAMPFYREMLGLDAPEVNVVGMARVGIAYLTVLGAATGLGFVTRGRWESIAAAVAFAWTAVALAVASASMTWTDFGRALPLAMLVLATALVVAWGRRGWAASPETAVRLALVVLSLCLLGKMFLRVRLEQYGFVLAMPAACVLVAAAVGWLPEAVARAGGSAAIARATALGALAVLVVVALRTDRFWLDRKTVVVAAGADALRADERGPVVSATLAELERRLAPDDTLVALPEGAMLNYLVRRPNPTPYAVFMPPEVSLFGEPRMVRALAARPPEWVVLVDKNTSEYGVARFGHDYGRRLYKWVKVHYRPVVTVGARPLRAAGFGVELWERTPIATAG